MARAVLALAFASAVAVAQPPSAPRVNVTFFSESLCPDCQAYNLGDWWKMWTTPGVGGVDGIINYNQVVWGNARLSPSGAITCQHGAEECKMNILQDCAVAHGNVSQYVPFIHCLELHGTQQAQFVDACAKTNGYDASALSTCAKGAEGQKLILAAAKATPADHTWVPWVTVNGVNVCLDSDPADRPCYRALAAVCDAYTGPKPAGCAAITSEKPRFASTAAW